MGKHEKFFNKLMLGRSDNNIDFQQLCGLLRKFGFQFRIEGSHHIFWKDGVDEIINIQPKNNQAKPYQAKQVRNLVLKYQLGEHDA